MRDLFDPRFGVPQVSKLRRYLQGIDQRHWTTRFVIVTAVTALCTIAFIAGLRIGEVFSGG